MIYSDGWTDLEKLPIVKAKIAGEKRMFRLVVTTVKQKPIVWVKSGDEHSMYYVVGIQWDGSIVRAQGLHSTWFPMDPRCTDGKVVVKKQHGQKYVSYTDGTWPTVEEVEWIQAEIAGEVRNFGLVTNLVGGMPVVWVITIRVGKEFVNFVVGIQHDGSILRAEKLSTSGLPIDPRCTNDVVVIKKQITG